MMFSLLLSFLWRIWLLNWICHFVLVSKLFFPYNSKHKWFCHSSVSKQKHSLVFTSRMCMNVNVCVCLCKCAKCMSVYQHRCVSCSNPRSVENRLMASRKLWPLRHGPLPLLQLLPSLSASLFVEIMPLTTEAYTRIPDLPIYSVTLSVSEMITHINYSLLL